MKKTQMDEVLEILKLKIQIKNLEMANKKYLQKIRELEDQIFNKEER